MTSYKPYIRTFLAHLQEKGVVEKISKVYYFNDDPKLYHYIVSMRCTDAMTDGKPQTLLASGFSLTSREFALFKALAETIERLGTLVYTKRTILYARYNALQKAKKNALDLHEIRTTLHSNAKKIGWIKGMDVLREKSVYLPAQLMYINYLREDEPHFYHEINTTGAAGGFDHETTLLRGIYECIERDAYMGVFLAMITPPRIAVDTINNRQVQHISALCQRYNLDLWIFDITHDLAVPTYMTMLVDKTGIGQAFSVGLKSHLDPYHAVMGSIEEALNTRPGFRNTLYKEKTNTYHKEYATINSFAKRSLFWSSPKQLEKLSFLFDAPLTPWKHTPFHKSPKEQLQFIKKTLIHKEFSLYYTDITPRSLLSLDYLVYNVFIPQLQPLYIQEHAKQIKYDRIQTIAQYFGKDTVSINPLPHIFL